MAQSPEWYYHRKSCTTCSHAQEFLQSHHLTPANLVDARKVSYDGVGALALLDGLTELIVTKGVKVVTIDLVDARPGNEVLLGLLLGRTGNLRAPALRVGPTLIVGYNQDVYTRLLT